LIYVFALKRLVRGTRTSTQSNVNPAQLQPSDSEIDVPNQMSQLRGLLLDDLSETNLVACELMFCCKRNVGSPFRGDITTSDTSQPQVLIVKAWTWLGLHCRTLFSVLTGNQSLDLSMSSTTATSQRLPPDGCVSWCEVGTERAVVFRPF
jgi:hypothetical protein